MKYVWLIALAVWCSGCEKNVDFKLNNTTPSLVVDAQIEDGQPPFVVLTKSLGYFNKIDPQLLANSFVRNAEVFVTNGIKTHKLVEYPIPITSTYTAYVYSNNLLAPTTSFVGEIGKSYQLLVKVDGIEYRATTNIPPLLFTLDSIWVKNIPADTIVTRRNLFFRSTDPPGLGNSGRYFTKKNSEQFLPGENSVFDDQIVDGTSFNSQIPQGIDRNNRAPSSNNFFKVGDTITLKWCNIPRSTYNFWNTWEFAAQSIGNPFAQPNKVIGNISNNALGAFCGYSVVQKTIVAQ